MGLMLYGLILVLFLGTGFTVVPHGSIGYDRLFGKVYRRDLGPGLHYLAPRPFVRIDHWPVREVMTNDAHEYMSGDLNLVSLSVNVQYRLVAKSAEDARRTHMETFHNAQSRDLVQANDVLLPIPILGRNEE